LFPSGQNRERSDMILVRMRNDNGVDGALGDFAKIRGGGHAAFHRMQSRIEDDCFSSRADGIRICADFCASGKAGELHHVGSYGLSALGGNVNHQTPALASNFPRAAKPPEVVLDMPGRAH